MLTPERNFRARAGVTPARAGAARGRHVQRGEMGTGGPRDPLGRRTAGVTEETKEGAEARRLTRALLGISS